MVKLTSTRHQQANFSLSDSGISETLSTNGVLPTQESFHPVLLDKGFQYTSATAPYLSELWEKGDRAALEFHLFEYNGDVGDEFNDLFYDKVSEEYASKFEVSVSPREPVQEGISSEQLAEVDLINKDFQCSSSTVCHLSDLAEIDPGIIAMHGLFDESLYKHDIDELKTLYSFNNRISSSKSIRS